jgi:hypothetical protein
MSEEGAGQKLLERFSLLVNCQILDLKDIEIHLTSKCTKIEAPCLLWAFQPYNQKPCHPRTNPLWKHIESFGYEVNE